MKLQLTIPEINDLLTAVFPQVGHAFSISALEPGSASVALQTGVEHLRPGGTVSGPAMFTIADLAFYVAVLAVIGPEALTVTTNANINFMRKPIPGVLRAEARVLKLGKTLAVGDVLVFSDGVDGPVAHASMTYAIPPSARPRTA